MEFTFDLSQTPLIGRRHVSKVEEKDSSAPSSSASSTIPPTGPTGSAGGATGSVITSSSASVASAAALSALPGPAQVTGSNLGTNALSPRRSVSLSPADSTNIAGWKRPWMSQACVFLLVQCLSMYHLNKKLM